MQPLYGMFHILFIFILFNDYDFIVSARLIFVDHFP